MKRLCHFKRHPDRWRRAPPGSAFARTDFSIEAEGAEKNPPKSNYTSPENEELGTRAGEH
jgi:hypothetical protein